MRVPTLCLALALAVLSALPDTTGAPTDVALTSGYKELTESSKSTELEEEQEYVTAETETSKVDHSVKKKISVTTNEKKSVLMYYVVSYKKLPKQRSSETKDEYYKRLFPKEDNLKVFYRKVMKCHEGEDASEYIARIEYIFTYIYPELDIRLDLDWLEQFDHYYTVKYCRKWNEPDKVYYERIFKKLDGECNETYKKRMECLVAALDEEDFTHVTFDDSELGYVVGERTTPCTSVSTPQSTAQGTGTRSSTVKSKSSEVDVDSSVTSIETDSSTSTQKKLTKHETTVEKETTTVTTSYKVAYTKLPDKDPGVCDEVFYKEFFGTYNDNISEEERNTILLRMCIMYMEESPAHYVQRIDYLMGHVYPQFDIRFEKSSLALLEYYYRLKYECEDNESVNEWFYRVLQKEQDESAEHYKRKVEILQEVFKSVNWSLVSIDENSSIGFTFVSESAEYSETSVDSTASTIYIQRGVKEDINEEEIKTTYAKLADEDYSTYYQRLTAISTETTEEYIEKITSIRKCFSELDLWYDLKYIDFTKEYYSKLFAKLSCETYEQYYERIIKKYSFETDVQCAKRIEILLHLYPELSLWHEHQYYEKFTKVIYQSIYCRSSSETVESYFERITQQLDGESDAAYTKRLRLIKLTHHSLDLWYDKTYEKFNTKYYKIKYTQGELEKVTSYYDRIVKKEIEETDEQCARRVELVRSILPNLSLWHDEKYYDHYTKSVYEQIYSKSLSEKDDDYYKRITEQTSGEADIVYINRLYLVKRTFNSLPLWYRSDYLHLTKSYYSIRYAKGEKEDDLAFYKRIVGKGLFETDEQCAYRVEIIHLLFPTLALWYDKTYYETYTRNAYQIIYDQRSNEERETYFSRIISQLDGESDDVYVQRISLVKQTVNHLSIWYDSAYSDLISKYYLPKYAKQDCEEWEDLYERIVNKEFDETDDQCAYRVEVLHHLYPNLTLWSYATYYEKFIKKHYMIIYQKGLEENEDIYFARIVTRFPKETDSTYIGRLDLVLKTYPTLNLWHNILYKDLLSEYIKIKYTKNSEESDEVYVARLLAKMDCDVSDLIYAKRIHLIHRLTVASSVWYSEALYDAYTKIYYSTYWSKCEDESCVSWLERVITQLDGECDDDAIKRIAFIKKTTDECGCWTVETLEEIKSHFTSEYYEKIKNLFFITEYSETTSVTSSSSSSESQDSSEEIVISRD